MIEIVGELTPQELHESEMIWFKEIQSYLLAEKYSFVLLQQSFHVIWSQNCYKRIEFELLIKM
jgi:hypothetical protein